MNKIVWIIVSWFGVSGLFKVARGTWGTLAALPFAYAVQITLGNEALFVAACVVFIIGCWASGEYIKATGKKDPNEVVVDEVAGIFLLLAFLQPTWPAYAGAFLVFRAFDVLKPWPVSWCDRKIGGGFGVMFDDVVAALYPVAIGYIAVMIFEPSSDLLICCMP